MPKADSNNSLDNKNELTASIGQALSGSEDLIMEQILDNINTTPLGRVLKRIAALPEVRKEKVLGIRRQITDGKYDLNGRLETAFDRILEDLTS